MEFKGLDRETAPFGFLQFARHCEVLCDGRPMPRREDFRLFDLPWLLGRLYQVDVLDGGADYRFRVFGVFWQSLYGDDLTGRLLSEIESGSRTFEGLRSHFDQIVAGREPVVGDARLVWPGLVTISFSRLSVPFTADGVSVAQIVVAAHCDDATDALIFDRGGAMPFLQREEDEPLPLVRVV